MSDTIRDFKDLIVRQKAMKFTQEVYRLTRLFPKEERYILTAQVRRAAISVPSNIAEGHTRQGREFAHFLSIARGSLAEVECQLLLAAGLGYFGQEELQEVNALIPEIRKMCITLARRCVPASPDPSSLTPDP
jgi:four helix bundle protein